tara:strand:+ start:1146 stop:1973 length:828 start_codon:yes stop_codon:yes gene_type:complete
MKVSKNKLRRIIAEELSGQSKNDNRFIRESIREIIIQEELQLEFLDKIKGAFGKIASGEFSKDMKKKMDVFLNGEKLELPGDITGKLEKAMSGAETLFQAMEKEPVTRKTEDDKKQKAVAAMEAIMKDFGEFVKEAGPAMTVTPDKSSATHARMKEFVNLVQKIDRIYTDGKRRKADKTLSKFDFSSLTPLIIKYKGKPVAGTEKGSDDGEEKTSAGKETEKILDGSAMKSLKTAFGKAKSKDAVKETLSAIFAELPEESKGYLKQALKDLAGGM